MSDHGYGTGWGVEDGTDRRLAEWREKTRPSRAAFPERTVRAAAAAIGNARRVARGLCALPDLLEVMPQLGQAEMLAGLMDDARAALNAAADDIEAERAEAARSES